MTQGKKNGGCGQQFSGADSGLILVRGRANQKCSRLVMRVAWLCRTVPCKEDSLRREAKSASS
jgi:hypothetical protein